jgi:hypothetical protein
MRKSVSPYQQRFAVLATNEASGVKKILMCGSMISGAPYWEDRLSAGSLQVLLMKTTVLAEFYAEMIRKKWPEPGWNYTVIPATLAMDAEGNTSASDAVKYQQEAVDQVQRILADHGYNLLSSDVESIMDLVKARMP